MFTPLSRGLINSVICSEVQQSHPSLSQPDNKVKSPAHAKLRIYCVSAYPLPLPQSHGQPGDSVGLDPTAFKPRRKTAFKRGSALYSRH